MKTTFFFTKNTAKKGFLAVFILSISLLFSFCSSSNDESKTDTPIVVDPGIVAPEFDLQNVAGMSVKLSDYKGKVVTLFFLGYNCPFCKSAAPNIESKLNKAYASRTDYAIVGLDQWNGNASAVQSFINSTSITFPVLLTASSVATAYKTTYDRLIVVDKKGNIAFSGSRGASSDIDAVKAKVDELLK